MNPLLWCKFTTQIFQKLEDHAGKKDTNTEDFNFIFENSYCICNCKSINE